eukprot:s7801_g1.t1
MELASPSRPAAPPPWPRALARGLPGGSREVFPEKASARARRGAPLVISAAVSAAAQRCRQQRRSVSLSQPLPPTRKGKKRRPWPTNLPGANLKLLSKYGDLDAAAIAGDVETAAAIFEEIRPQVPENLMRLTFNTVIKACANAADLIEAERWYGRLLAAGLLPNKAGE